MHSTYSIRDVRRNTNPICLLVAEGILPRWYVLLDTVLLVLLRLPYDVHQCSTVGF